jgi:hypothetical protein
MTYEYQVLTATSAAQLEQKLPMFGDHGWQVVGMASINNEIIVTVSRETPRRPVKPGFAIT